MQVYISYRRADAAAWAGRLSDALAQRWGETSILRDVNFLEAGADFRAEIARALDAANVMLVVIGPQWLGASGVAGVRRIDDPDDTVRSEIAQFLQAGKRVLPVLVGGARMPPAGDMPADIAALCRAQAITLRDDSWQADIGRVAAALQSAGTSEPVQPRPAAPAPTRAGPQGHPQPRKSRTLVWTIAAITVVLAAVGMGLLWFLELGGKTSTIPSPVPEPMPVPPPVPAAALPWWPFLLLAAVLVLAVAGWLLLRRRRGAPQQAGWVTGAGPRQALPEASPLPVKQVDVFVSHAEEDHDLAEAIVNQLERGKLRCWIAPRDIPAGVRSWAGPIVEAIARSRVFVVILSASSNGSIEVLREVTLANEERVPFLPVRIDSSPLSPDFRYFFATAQRTEAVGWPRDKVLSAIHNGVGALVKGYAA